MIIPKKYFYKIAMTFAAQQGFSIKDLADVCGVRPETLSKMLRRVDGSDLDSENASKIRDVIAPSMTLDELYKEADELAVLRMSVHDD